MTLHDPTQQEVAELRDAYAAGEIGDDELEARLRALAEERAAIEGDGEDAMLDDPSPDAIRLASAAPLMLPASQPIDRIIAAIGAACHAYLNYQPRR